MEDFLYRLEFKGPVHFGTIGIGLEKTLDYLPSDSLSSALINAFAVLGTADEVVRALRSDRPPFVLSSLFPFGPSQKENQRTYALPRPLTGPPVETPEVLRDLGRDLKRVRYLIPDDFFRWIGEKPLSGTEAEAVLAHSREIGKGAENGSEAVWSATELRPRVALDRTSQNSSIWHCNVLHFHPSAGLYGLVRFLEQSWTAPLASAFRALGDLGLGGERTYGMGCFRFSGFEPVRTAWPTVPIEREDRLVLLSVFHPSSDELTVLGERLVAWNFAESRGYVVSGRTPSTIKRKRLNMITEGSVFAKPVKGALVDVTPDGARALGLPHSVYRSGLAFLLPGGAIQ